MIGETNFFPATIMRDELDEDGNILTHGTLVIWYPDYKDDLIDGDKILTEEKEISIWFDYPMVFEKIAFHFKSKNGFSNKRFWEAVYVGYLHIYHQVGGMEQMSIIDHVRAVELDFDFPRLTARGNLPMYHDISALVLEGYKEVAPGEFELSIGS